MKKLFLSIALLLQLCTLATAQGKTQFGVTVQAGNYLQAQREQKGDEHISTIYRLTGGVLVGLGAYAERTLCKHVALYSGLNFSQSAFIEQSTDVYLGQIIIQTGVDKQTRQFTVRQLTLPVQLQLRAGKRRSLSFSTGIAPSLAISTLRSDENSRVYGCGVGGTPFPNYRYSNETSSSAKFQMLFTTGLHYYPNAKNALGLEFWLAPKAKEAEVDAHFYDYGSYTMPRRSSYRMRSLQVSLRHSW